MAEFEIDLNELLSDGNLPNPQDYQYYRSLANNTIVINRDIDDDLIEYAILPYMQLDADPNVKEITVIINTMGGALHLGMSFVSALEHGHTPTTLRIIGDADSMGTLIMMAQGDHIHKVCDPWCVGLLHAGSQSAAGDTNAVNDQIKFNQQFEKKVEEFILTHSKIDKKLYNKMKRIEYWMDADEMLRLGIVDEII